MDRYIMKDVSNRTEMACAIKGGSNCQEIDLVIWIDGALFSWKQGLGEFQKLDESWKGRVRFFDYRSAIDRIIDSEEILRKAFNIV